MDTRTITIRITSPSSSDCITLPDVPAQKTVADLKQLVTERYPSHPLPNEQRLIFAGQLLNDIDTLEKCISGPACSDKTNATIHLVVRSSMNSTPSKPNMPNRTIPPSPSTTQATAENSTMNTADNHPTIVPLSAPFQYVLYNGQPYLMPLNNLQQQPQQQHAQNVLQRFPQFAQAFRQRHLTPEQQRAEVQRRTANLWLALRLFVMVYIFSQGASLERQLVFHVLALAIYLWQSGTFSDWARTLGLQQRDQQRLDVQPQAEPVVQNQNANAAAPAQPTAPQARQQAPPANAQGHMRNLSNHPVVRDIEQCLVAFISSLVPQNPPRIEGADIEAENNNNERAAAAAAADAAAGGAGGGIGGAFL